MDELQILYNKKVIVKKTLLGFLPILFGIYLLIQFDFPGLGKSLETDGSPGVESAMFRLCIVFSIFLWGTIAILRNLFRLLAKHPQVILTAEGIFLAEYKAWKILPWTGITDIQKDIGASYSSQGKEPIIVLKLSKELAKKVFEEEAFIKTRYLDYDEDKVYERIHDFWKLKNTY